MLPALCSAANRVVAGFSDVPLPVEMSPANESPPITDTDDSPPPIRRRTPGADGGEWPDGTTSVPPQPATSLSGLPRPHAVRGARLPGVQQRRAAPQRRRLPPAPHLQRRRHQAESQVRPPQTWLPLCQ